MVTWVTARETSTRSSQSRTKCRQGIVRLGAPHAGDRLAEARLRRQSAGSADAERRNRRRRAA